MQKEITSYAFFWRTEDNKGVIRLALAGGGMVLVGAGRQRGLGLRRGERREHQTSD